MFYIKLPHIREKSISFNTYIRYLNEIKYLLVAW